jgi:hypothetical protein
MWIVPHAFTETPHLSFVSGPLRRFAEMTLRLIKLLFRLNRFTQSRQRNGGAAGFQEVVWLRPVFKSSAYLFCARAICAIVISALFSAWAQADAPIRLTFAPMHPERASSKFELEITEPPEGISFVLFEMRIVRFEDAPVSEMRLSFACTQGISICGLSFDGKNRFGSAAILLDEDLNQVNLYRFDLCRIKYVFTDSAYYYLFKFDWSIDEANIKYYDSRRLPPDFMGIDSWILVESNCKGA